MTISELNKSEISNENSSNDIDKNKESEKHSNNDDIKFKNDSKIYNKETTKKDDIINNERSYKSSSDLSSSSEINQQKEKSNIKNLGEISNNKEEKNNSKKPIVKYISMPMNIKINQNDDGSNKPQASTILLLKGNNSILTKSLNLYFPSFSNLITTNEDSFELISSYENINKITNNLYVNNHSLQSKTKQFLINECISSFSRNSTPLKAKISKNFFRRKSIINKDKNTKKCSIDKNQEEDNKSVNSFYISKYDSNRNLANISDNKEKKIENIKKRRHE
jgi:hypothetical protein